LSLNLVFVFTTKPIVSFRLLPFLEVVIWRIAAEAPVHEIWIGFKGTGFNFNSVFCGFG